jgi:hypothetical protein
MSYGLFETNLEGFTMDTKHINSNQLAHDFLTDQGAYIHRRVEAYFEDGTLAVAYDVYEGDSHYLYIDGLLIGQYLIDWDQERFFESQDM